MFREIKKEEQCKVVKLARERMNKKRKNMTGACARGVFMDIELYLK